MNIFNRSTFSLFSPQKKMMPVYACEIFNERTLWNCVWDINASPKAYFYMLKVKQHFLKIYYSVLVVVKTLSTKWLLKIKWDFVFSLQAIWIERSLMLIRSALCNEIWEIVYSCMATKTFTYSGFIELCVCLIRARADSSCKGLQGHSANDCKSC